MPPQLALLITIILIVYLFRRDGRESVGVTSALWIPLLWTLVISGKTVALWIYICFNIELTDGISPDSIVWTLLIFAGFRVLQKRGVTFSEVLRSNRWIAVWLIYSLISVLWSDVPFKSIKHWIAVLGHPIMALIVMTEPDPMEALERLMKRFAYVAIPISYLLIRYYPQWGRSNFDIASMSFQKAGFAFEKNSLGVICMILGLFFSWHILNTWNRPRYKGKMSELILCTGFMGSIALLFIGLNCGTALVSLVIGAGVCFLVSLPFVNPKHLGTYLIVGVVFVVGLEAVFGIKEYVLQFLNKDPTLTGRTDFWPELIAFKPNPLLGAGYESFWEGERLRLLWEKYWWKPNEAHNGYVETYLNLGLVGLFSLFAVIVAVFFKIRSRLQNHSIVARLQLGFLAATVLYNWSEAGYKTLSPVYLMLFMIGMDLPRATEPEYNLEEYELSEPETNLPHYPE